MPNDFEKAIKVFIAYYNYQRYYEGLDNVTKCDVYTGRRLEIIWRRKEVKSETLKVRKDYNEECQGAGQNRGIPCSI
jgi:hypothetical protein